MNEDINKETNIKDSHKKEGKTLIVLLRGLSRDSFHWFGFDELLANEFTPGSVKIKCLDLPGFGQRHKESSPLSISKISEIVLGELTDFKEFEKTVLIGLSLGGMVALSDIIKNPNKWTHCLILSSSQKSKTYFWQRFNLKTLPAFLFGGFFYRPLFEKTAFNATINFSKNREKEVQAWVSHFKRLPFKRRSVFKQLLAGARFKLKESDFKKVKTKGLILASYKDRFVSHKNSRVISKITTWPVEYHKDAGHDLTYDDPSWVIKNFKNLLNT